MSSFVQTSRAIAVVVLLLLAPGCRCASFTDLDPLRCDGPGADCGTDRVCAELSDGNFYCVGADPTCMCDDGDPCNGVETCNPDNTCNAGVKVDCTAMADACNAGTCNPSTGACEGAPLPDGTPCDDSMFCTDPDFCSGGACSGDPRDCSMMGQDFCEAGGCDEATDMCTGMPLPPGSPCSDGLFCNEGETCQMDGTCGGGMARDCSGVEDDCNGSMCDDGADVCVAAPLMDGTACEDGLFCTTGDTCMGGICSMGAPMVCDDTNPCTADSCDDTMDDCVFSSAPLDGTMCDDGNGCTSPDMCNMGVCSGPTCDDGASCTGTSCAGMVCDFTRFEGMCGSAAEICNPVEYPGGTGCGAPPTSLNVACTDATPGSSAACVLSLDGIAGEQDRITCTTRPGPVELFRDDFNSGSFDPLWSPSSGTPLINNDLPTGNAAVAVDPAPWASDITLGAQGLSVICIDFDLGQEGADTGEAIRWQRRFDSGAFADVFLVDFSSWEADDVMHTHNRNVCFNVIGTPSTVTLRLSMETGNHKLYVDNVVVSGIGAFLNPAPPLSGPDAFDNLNGWTTVSGTPQVGLLTGNSALYADSETFELDRTVDATNCDVVDVDFDFAFTTPDNVETIELSYSVDGGTLMLLEDLDLADNVWNMNSVLLPWFGLRRVSDLDPAAAGSNMVKFRFYFEATGGGRRVWADEFIVRCADIPDPTVNTVMDVGGGTYSVTVDSAVAASVFVECTWTTSDGNGPLTGSDTFFFIP